jgi:hypothetical protein
MSMVDSEVEPDLRSHIERSVADPERRAVLAMVILWVAAAIGFAGTAFRVDEPNILAIAPQIVVNLAETLEASKRMRTVAWAVAGALLLFSVGSTQEYLSWNRARWHAVELLRRQHVPLTKVDGGYEVNQYLVGGFDAQAPIDRLENSAIYGSDYVIAFHPLYRYGAAARFPYAGFFGARQGEVLLLKKRPGKARGTAR